MEWYINPAQINNSIHQISDIIIQDISKERKNDVALIFEEAYVNIVKYSYPSSQKKPLRIKWIGDPIYKMTFIDDGIAFDPTVYNVGIPDGSQIGGHGIRLMRSLSKKMSYQRIAGKNILEIWV